MATIGLIICAIAWGTTHTAPEGFLILGGGLILFAAFDTLAEVAGVSGGSQSHDGDEKAD